MKETAIAVILGSAFADELPEGVSLSELQITTPWGEHPVHRVEGVERPAYVLFRHGRPHRLLPHQIPYRAQAWALRAVRCGALLVTSSVGVLDRNVPLYRPLLLGDLLMPGNRLPDGSPCTMFERPTAGQGHLVVNEGLFSRRLTEQVAELASSIGAPAAATVVFAFSEGPRTKTAAENRMWATLGAHVNSMSVGPEVVLANELEIPCAGLAVGHKYSVPDIEAPADPGTVADTLEESRRVLDRLVFEFLRRGQPVPFGNHLFRFGDAEE